MEDLLPSLKGMLNEAIEIKTSPSNLEILIIVKKKIDGVFAEPEEIIIMLTMYKGCTMVWEKGQSGNPNGRPPGFKHQEFFHEIIQNHRVDLLNLAIEKAKNGNSVMHRFILERFIPKVPMDALEYQKLELEIEKLRAENAILNEAPELLEIIKEDPLIKDRIKERLKRRTFIQGEIDNGKTNEITTGTTENTTAKEGSTSGY